MDTLGLNDFVKLHFTCITNDGLMFSIRDKSGLVEFFEDGDRLLKPFEEKIAHEKIYGTCNKVELKEFKLLMVPINERLMTIDKKLFVSATI
jgi:hypothetical protein